MWERLFIDLTKTSTDQVKDILILFFPQYEERTLDSWVDSLSTRYLSIEEPFSLFYGSTCVGINELPQGYKVTRYNDLF